MMTALIVTNREPLDSVSQLKLSTIVDTLGNSNIRVHGFYEDYSLVSAMAGNHRIKYIETLNSYADKLLFEGSKPEIYKSGLKVDFVGNTATLYKDIYARALKRYPTPREKDSYDELAYKSKRLSVLESRSRFVMYALADTYDLIVMFKSTQEFEYCPNLKPAEYDGKMFLIYDVKKHTTKFVVGGCILNEKDFYLFAEEVKPV